MNGRGQPCALQSFPVVPPSFPKFVNPHWTRRDDRQNLVALHTRVFHFHRLSSSAVAAASAVVLALGLPARSIAAGTSASAPITLDPLTVTTHPTGANERPGAVWVVPLDAELPGPLHVRDQLLTVPGVHLNQPGGAGGRSSLWIRGAEDNYGIIYLDGIPLNDSTNVTGGAVDFSLIDPALVQSAAVVRGPSSVRYGAEALAGVVHLGLDADAADVRHAEFELGGNHLRRAALVLQQPLTDNTSFAFTAAGANAGSLAWGSRGERRAWRGAVTHRGPINVKFVAWHLTNDAATFPDDSGGRRLAEIQTLETRRQRATAAALQLSGAFGERRWSLAVDAAQFDADIASPGVAPGLRDPFGLPASTNDTRLRRLRVKAMVEQDLRDWRVAGGIDFERETGRDHGSLQLGPDFILPTEFALDRNHGGVFAEAHGPLAGDVTLALGGRVDRYGGELTRGTVRAGLLGHFDAATEWRVNAGNAFKPPSFFALASPIVGNPDLRPERGVTIDAGVRRRIHDGRGLLDVSVFSSRFKNGTDFDAGPPPQIVNRNEINCTGAELALEWRLTSTWRVGGSYTYVDARRDPGDVRMRARPRWRAGLFSSLAVSESFTLTGSMLAIGGVPDSSIPTGDITLPGWERFDLGAIWRVQENWSLTAAIENVFDADYEEAVGFPALGRTVRGGVRVQF